VKCPKCETELMNTNKCEKCGLDVKSSEYPSLPSSDNNVESEQNSLINGNQVASAQLSDKENDLSAQGNEQTPSLLKDEFAPKDIEQLEREDGSSVQSASKTKFHKAPSPSPHSYDESLHEAEKTQFVKAENPSPQDNEKNIPNQDSKFIIEPPQHHPLEAANNGYTKKSPENNKTKIEIDDSGIENFANSEKGVIYQKIIKNYNYSQPPPQKKDMVIELSTTLPQRTTALPEVDHDELEKAFTILEDNHILIISSFERGISKSAAYSLANKFEFNSEQKRIIDFDIMKIEADLQIESFLDEFLSNNSELLFVVKAHNSANDKAQTFFDSLFVEDGFDIIKSGLKKNNVFLICIIEPRVCYEKNIEMKEGFCAHWRIDFLEPLLKSYYPKDYKQLKEELLKQTKDNRWSSDDKEFHEDILGYLRNAQLITEIEKRKTKTEKEIDVTLLFTEDEYIELKKYIYYVATCFPSLSPTDFNRIIKLLIKNKTVRVTVFTKQINEKGEEKKIENFEKKELKKMWIEMNDKLLSECYIEAPQLQDGSRVIEFRYPYLRRRLKDYMERNHAMFMEEQFETVKNKGFLFDYSDGVFKGTIQLAVEMAISNTKYHGKKWLIEIISGLNYSDILNVEGKNVGEILRNIGNQIEKKKREWDHIHSRLVLLIREMINYQRLEKLVNDFLEHLFSLSHESLLEIVKRLKSASRFDGFYWMKQLLDRGNEDVREKTYNSLLYRIESKGSNFYELLRKIEKWLPESKDEPERYSNSNRLALKLLIVDISINTTLNFNFKNYGQWKSSLSIFKSIDMQSAQTDLAILINWLFHSGMEHISELNDPISIAELTTKCCTMTFGIKKNLFIKDKEFQSVIIMMQVMAIVDKVNDDPQELLIYIISVLLSEWFIILNGLEKKPTMHEEAKKVFEIILKKITQITQNDKKAKRSLISYWKTANEFIETLNRHPNAISKTEKTLLNNRRKLNRKLINDFKVYTEEMEYN
jgi:hypothetical protein